MGSITFIGLVVGGRYDNSLGPNVAPHNPKIVQRLLALAEGMREDLGDSDRVGRNMRFFDPIDPRPAKPPVPRTRKPRPRK